MIPGNSLNCLLTSSTISIAALPTAVIVKAENKNVNIPPMNNPAITSGSVTSIINGSVVNLSTASLYAANRDRAVKAADPIANPLPTAAVEFPTASSLSVVSLTS